MSQIPSDANNCNLASIKCTNNVTEIFPIKRYYFGFKNRFNTPYLEGSHLGVSTSISRQLLKYTGNLVKCFFLLTFYCRVDII